MKKYVINCRTDTEYCVVSHEIDGLETIGGDRHVNVIHIGVKRIFFSLFHTALADRISR